MPLRTGASASPHGTTWGRVLAQHAWSPRFSPQAVGFLTPRLTSLCSWDQLRPSGPPASTAQVLGPQVYNTMPSLCGARIELRTMCMWGRPSTYHVTAPSFWCILAKSNQTEIPTGCLLSASTLANTLHSSTRQVSSPAFQDKEAKVWWGEGDSFSPCTHTKISAQSAWLQSPGSLHSVTMTVFLGPLQSTLWTLLPPQGHLLTYCFEWHLLWFNFLKKANVSYSSCLNIPSFLKRMPR